MLLEISTFMSRKSEVCREHSGKVSSTMYNKCKYILVLISFTIFAISCIVYGITSLPRMNTAPGTDPNVENKKTQYEQLDSDGFTFIMAGIGIMVVILSICLRWYYIDTLNSNNLHRIVPQHIRQRPISRVGDDTPRRAMIVRKEIVEKHENIQQQ